MPLTNLPRLKIHLGITGGSQDAALNQWLAEVEAGVRRFLLGRRLDSHTVVEYHDGPGRGTLFLRQRPVTAITEVRVDAAGMGGQNPDGFGSTSVWDQGVSFYAASLAEDETNPGELICGSGWPSGTGNIKVTYVAGYSVVPADVQLAVHQLVSRVRDDTEHGRPLQSETLGSYSYSLLAAGDEGKEMTSARSALMKYRSIVI